MTMRSAAAAVQLRVVHRGDDHRFFIRHVQSELRQAAKQAGGGPRRRCRVPRIHRNFSRAYYAQGRLMSPRWCAESRPYPNRAGQQENAPQEDTEAGEAIVGWGA